MVVILSQTNSSYKDLYRYSNYYWLFSSFPCFGVQWSRCNIILLNKSIILCNKRRLTKAHNQWQSFDNILRTKDCCRDIMAPKSERKSRDIKTNARLTIHENKYETRRIEKATPSFVTIQNRLKKPNVLNSFISVIHLN